MWKCEEARTAKSTSKMKNDAGELILPDLKISYRVTIFNTMWYWCQKRPIEQRNGVETQNHSSAMEPQRLACIHTGHANKSLNHC